MPKHISGHSKTRQTIHHGNSILDNCWCSKTKERHNSKPLFPFCQGASIAIHSILITCQYQSPLRSRYELGFQARSRWCNCLVQETLSHICWPPQAAQLKPWLDWCDDDTHIQLPSASRRAERCHWLRNIPLAPDTNPSATISAEQA